MGAAWTIALVVRARGVVVPEWPIQFHSFQHEWGSVWDRPGLGSEASELLYFYTGSFRFSKYFPNYSHPWTEEQVDSRIWIFPFVCTGSIQMNRLEIFCLLTCPLDNVQKGEVEDWFLSLTFLPSYRLILDIHSLETGLNINCHISVVFILC